MRSRSAIVLPVQAAKLVGDPKRYAGVAAYLLTPVALTAYVMAFWRLGADLNWLSEFFITKGLLSKWQVWLALAIMTQFGAHHLNRRRADETVTPQA